MAALMEAEVEALAVEITLLIEAFARRTSC
jgi:hypothetical protein